LRTGARPSVGSSSSSSRAPVIVERIGQTIGMLRSRGFTVLMVEQNYRFASRLADRFYVIEEGRVAAHLHRAELDAQRDRVESLLGL
ncbi:MAG: ABC transporter ATP-binding protein, partial [Comamonadaceae bacterium]